METSCDEAFAWRRVAMYDGIARRDADCFLQWSIFVRSVCVVVIAQSFFRVAGLRRAAALELGTVLLRGAMMLASYQPKCGCCCCSPMAAERHDLATACIVTYCRKHWKACVWRMIAMYDAIARQDADVLLAVGRPCAQQAVASLCVAHDCHA